MKKRAPFVQRASAKASKSSYKLRICAFFVVVRRNAKRAWVHLLQYILIDYPGYVVLIISGYTKGSSNLSGKRVCNSEYRSVDGLVLSVIINSYPYNHVNLT